MPSLEEYRLWSAKFHWRVTTRTNHDYKDILCHLSIRNTHTELLCSAVDQTNKIKTFGHNQEPHGIGMKKVMKIDYKLGCNWIKESEIMMITANTWIPVASATSEKVAIAAMCVVPEPISLIEQRRDGICETEEMWEAQMKSFIRWLLKSSAVPSTVQGCQLVSLQNPN